MVILKFEAVVSILIMKQSIIIKIIAACCLAFPFLEGVLGATCTNYVDVGTGLCVASDGQSLARCFYSTANAPSAAPACDGDDNCVGKSVGSNFHLHYINGGPSGCPGTGGTFVAGVGSGCPTAPTVGCCVQCLKKQCADGSCGAGGDPHWRRFGGQRYNYHGECDLILVSTKTFQGGQNLDVHVRTKIESVYSIITAIAILFGSLVFEFNHETIGYPTFLINGTPITALPYEDDQLKVSTHDVYNEDFNKMIQMITVAIGTDATLHISIMDQWVHVDMDAKNIFDSMGLAGSFPNGKMLARDGSTDLSHDRNAYGSEWQVQEDEPKLFHSIPEGHPQAPHATCKMPLEDAHQYLRTRSSEMYNMAVEACKKEGISGLDLEDCVFDVSVMNNPKIAAAWWAVEKEE